MVCTAVSSFDQVTVSPCFIFKISGSRYLPSCGVPDPGKILILFSDVVVIPIEIPSN